MDMDTLGFAIKKAVSAAVMPSGIIFLLLLAGLFFWPLKRQRTSARNAFFLAFVIYALGSSGPVSSLLLMGLETRVPQEFQPNPAITDVVVLCGGIVSSEVLPPGDRLTCHTRMRVLAGTWISSTVPGIERLLVVGGTKEEEGKAYSEAGTSRDWIEDMGLSPQVKTILIEKTRDTEENLAEAARILAGRPAYLVTSALHMPRALMIAKRIGMDVTPIPCDYLASGISWSLRDLWPSPIRLYYTDSACHEYLGIAWQLLKDLPGRLVRLF